MSIYGPLCEGIFIGPEERKIDSEIKEDEKGYTIALYILIGIGNISSNVA